MSILYVLRENHLTPDPNDYMAYTEASSTIELSDIIADMINRGSTVTKADIVSVIEDLLRSLKVYLALGANINLPIANFSISVKGVFNGNTDVFDPSRHQLALNVQPGKELKAFMRSGLTTEKLETLELKPALSKFTDLVSGESNSIVTPGGLGQIEGYRLKINTDDETEGIYLIKEDASEVKISVIGQNKALMLLFLIPADLTSGDYHLEVRSKTGDTLKTGRLTPVLSVA